MQLDHQPRQRNRLQKSLLRCSSCAVLSKAYQQANTRGDISGRWPCYSDFRLL